MEYVYVMTCGEEWEDIVIYLTQEEAIESSMKYPDIRVEIFSKHQGLPGYRPTYKYYENGKMYDINDNMPVS